MIQNIIVALIVAAALAYTGYSIYRSVKPGQKTKSGCGGCTGCDLKNMKNSCENTTQHPESRLKYKAFSQRLMPFKEK